MDGRPVDGLQLFLDLPAMAPRLLGRALDLLDLGPQPVELVRGALVPLGIPRLGLSASTSSSKRTKAYSADLSRSVALSSACSASASSPFRSSTLMPPSPRQSRR
jgi:hypothetical protein